MAIAFRCDSSIEIGSGHVMRCLALAKRFCRYENDISFYCQKRPGHLGQLIENQGFKLHWIESEDFVLPAETHLLVVDHYLLDYKWEQKFSKKLPLFVIDDLHDRAHDCKWLLDTSYRKEQNLYDELINQDTVLFLGPKYCLLREEFIETKKRLSLISKKHDFLVFFGGTDSSGETLRFLQALNRNEISARFLVLVSQNNTKIEEIKKITTRSNVEVIIQPENIANLMAECRFFVGSGGTITWERLYLQIPGVVFSVAENQVEMSKNLSDLGFQIYAGSAQSVNYEKWLGQLPTLVQKTKPVPKDFVNIFPEAVIRGFFVKDFYLKRAGSEDSDFLFHLRNDELTRKMSKTTEQIPRPQHEHWLNSKLNDEKCRIYIGIKDNQNCGQVRIDEGGLVSTAISPGFRGQGLSSVLVRAGIEKYANEFGMRGPFKAEIKNDNLASIKAFEDAGFVKMSDGEFQTFFCSI